MSNICRAELADLNACLQMDPSFTTDHVWQMDVRDTDGEITVAFRTARLPRPMKAAYPRDSESVVENWRRGECFLVAYEDDRLLGFVDATLQTWNSSGWINNIVVDRVHRRRGVGALLLRAAVQWAQELRLLKLVAEAQTKNYPAICFFQKNGFSFCGYNDRYYVNGDIALFFVQPLR